MGKFSPLSYFLQIRLNQNGQVGFCSSYSFGSAVKNKNKINYCIANLKQIFW